jgi:phage N-6-adenine-methyltransferase
VSEKGEDQLKDLVSVETGEITQFDPQKTQRVNAKADAVIDYAKKLKDWPLLERAVDEKIEQQREFVGWWETIVTPNKGGDRKSENQSARSTTLICEDAENLTGISKEQVSKWRRWLKRETEYRAAIYGAAYKAAMAQDQNYRAEGTGENEWYTPARYIEAARTAMGSIDLDPASCDEAQQTVRAAAYFDKDTNGLEQEWHGNVWLNPPFSRDLIGLFTHKVIAEFAAGRTSQAVFLTHNNTDTEWFHALAMVSSALCFTRGRIPFFRGEWVAAPPNGQVFFYFGSRDRAFYGSFADIGLVLSVVS